MLTVAAPADESTPIRFAHIWRVYDWHSGGWRDTGTVQTWTRNHALACRKAKEGTPALRSQRFKVVHAGREDVGGLTMRLARLTVRGKDWPAWRVEDTYSEYAALVRENRRERAND